jgi:hypothetical protein
MLSTYFNNMLAARVKDKNNQYHTIVHDIFSKQQPDIEKLRNELVEKGSDKTESKQSISVSVTINMDELFTDKYSYITHPETNKLTMIKNDVVEFYFIGSRPLPASYKFNKGIITPSEQKQYHIELSKSCAGSEVFNAFKVYFYTTDPDVCELRDKLRSAFPDATISPWLFVHNSRSSEFIIEITYTLDDIKNLVELEKSKVTSWFEGDIIRW